MTDIYKKSLDAHAKYHGKLEVCAKVPLDSPEDLNLYYTPGVAEPCRKIEQDENTAYLYTGKGNTIAVVTDGSAVLGLGNIGAMAGLPVMEGKCALFKRFGDVNAVPICLNTQNPDEIIKVVKAISPSFGGINLEDIKAPNCFEIEERLIDELNIPVFHDDQHGTAIVCLAGLINALKVVEKNVEDVKIAVSGAGSAGIAISKLLLKYGFKNIVLLDSKGIINSSRNDLNKYKKEMAERTNPNNIDGDLKTALVGADIFIGVSKPNLLTSEMVATMNDDSIIFAMSNPVPEIMPEEAKKGGARIVATGRSDYPNQINNVLVFPGIFKGALRVRASKFTDEMKLKSAEALANLVSNPNENKIIPGVFDDGVADAIANVVATAYNLEN